MNGQTEVIDLPYEIQKKILDQLKEKDLISMHRVSKSWQVMIGKYMSDKCSIKSKDWKWFCRHRPQKPHCSQCLERMRNKNDARGLADDWNWWL